MMNSEHGLKLKDEDNQIRESTVEDARPSQPSPERPSLFEKEGPLTEPRVHVPEDVRKSARQRSLAEKIRREHDGDGFVIVNIRSGEIIDTAGDLQDVRYTLEDANISAEDSLVVSCYDR